jgi:cardiolipin synthase A/B
VFLEAYNLLLDAIGVLALLFALIIVLNDRKSPAVTWAWLCFIILSPYIGLIIYLIVGYDSRKNKIFLQKLDKDNTIYYKSLKRINKIEVKEDYSRFKYLIDLNLNIGFGHFKDNNEIKMYIEGNDKFEDLLKSIKEAKKFIHLEYYIIKNDNIGNKMIQALTEKAMQGVEVRLLLDGMGNILIPKKIFEGLVLSGGEVGIFYPPHLARLNYRNHRKIAVIDGSIGYIGGLNIGDEYLGKSKKFGYWRDTHMQIIGDSVKDLNLRFIMDWNFTKAKKIEILEKYLPNIEKVSKNVGIQIVSSGPDTTWHCIQYGYFKIINEAKKYIYVQTPYFVPNESILEALKVAALSGVEVKIMIPAKPDHPFVYWASTSYMGELLLAGVKCYKYEKGFVHSKIIIVDDLVYSIGTANMDVRSFSLNFEINAFVYDNMHCKYMATMFLHDIKHSKEMTIEDYEKRSFACKLKEIIARLLSPVM